LSFSGISNTHLFSNTNFAAFPSETQEPAGVRFQLFLNLDYNYKNTKRIHNYWKDFLKRGKKSPYKSKTGYSIWTVCNESRRGPCCIFPTSKCNHIAIRVLEQRWIYKPTQIKNKETNKQKLTKLVMKLSHHKASIKNLTGSIGEIYKSALDWFKN
jgi:hypothetical protein